MEFQNLAKLPKKQRDKIERDKRRSFECHKMLTSMPRWKIRAKVSQIPEPEQQLYRDTLNRMIEAGR